VSKTTITVASPGGSTHNLAAELLAGGKHVIQHVATAIPTVVGVQTITVPTTATTLAALCTGAALPANATHALFNVRSTGGTVYWIDDGGINPSATHGFEATAGSYGEWLNLAGVELIATVSTLIAVSFRRYDA
jgi:hypothetical protein